jgi:hypothetical protein
MDIKLELERVQSFVEDGNFHAAMNIAISGLNECRRNHDQACTDKFLRMINHISLTMAREFGSKAYLDEITKS